MSGNTEEALDVLRSVWSAQGQTTETSKRLRRHQGLQEDGGCGL